MGNTLSSFIPDFRSRDKEEIGEWEFETTRTGTKFQIEVRPWSPKFSSRSSLCSTEPGGYSSVMRRRKEVPAYWRVAAVQMKFADSIAGNLEKIERAVRAAARRGA